VATEPKRVISEPLVAGRSRSSQPVHKKQVRWPPKAHDPITRASSHAPPQRVPLRQGEGKKETSNQPRGVSLLIKPPNPPAQLLPPRTPRTPSPAQLPTTHLHPGGGEKWPIFRPELACLISQLLLEVFFAAQVPPGPTGAPGTSAVVSAEPTSGFRQQQVPRYQHQYQVPLSPARPRPCPASGFSLLLLAPRS
jgi:hypothetical protein